MQRFLIPAGCSLLLLPGLAEAHSFGRLYTLPVPFWMYAWGAAATLLISFVMVGWLVSHSPAEAQTAKRDLSRQAWATVFVSRPALWFYQGFSLAGFLLCIATGLFGTANAYLNLNMTFFWIVFLLGFTYFTALVGGLYEAINPWRSLIALPGRLLPNLRQGRFSYPDRLGCWPALGLYMLFIWLELFGSTGPRALAYLLLAYAVINLAGVWLIGSRAWFRHVEFFSVLFRLIARMAPLQYHAPSAGEARGRLTLQAPFSGLLQSRAGSMSEVLFVLFILSSTAFDGLHQTTPWVRLYWEGIGAWLQPWAGGNIVQAYPLLRTMHDGFQTLSLLVSPFVYLAVYLACLAVMKRLTRCELSLHALALRFAHSLLPIALVYHITHYWTLILSQGAMILRLVSDPFGRGWNLFGTARMLPEPIIPNMDWVWHTQVWLILFGHIVSVYIAHREALRLFPSRRAATISQLPMLVLMITFTCFGLWILAQPITSTVIQ